MSSETAFEVQDNEKRVRLVSQGDQTPASEPAQRTFLMPGPRMSGRGPSPCTQDTGRRCSSPALIQAEPGRGVHR